MAWYFNGMSPKELAVLVDSMTHSGYNPPQFFRKFKFI